MRSRALHETSPLLAGIASSLFIGCLRASKGICCWNRSAHGKLPLWRYMHSIVSSCTKLSLLCSIFSSTPATPFQHVHFNYRVWKLDQSSERRGRWKGRKSRTRLAVRITEPVHMLFLLAIRMQQLLIRRNLISFSPSLSKIDYDCSSRGSCRGSRLWNSVLARGTVWQ